MDIGSADGPPDLRATVLIAILLGSLAFAVFSPAIGYDFINYDDDAYVFENAQVTKGLSPSGISYALTTRNIGTWAPLTWLSYELDTSLLGFKASSYHTTNILLHAVLGVLLFVALQLMLRS